MSNNVPQDVAQALQLLNNRPILQQKILEFVVGRDPHPSANGQAIFHMLSPHGKEFEWHPKTRNFYMIRTTAEGKRIGEIVAFNIETHADAINAVLIWGRGYAEGRTPTIEKPHLQD